jgi:hypothetical protein
MGRVATHEWIHKHIYLNNRNVKHLIQNYPYPKHSFRMLKIIEYIYVHF